MEEVNASIWPRRCTRLLKSAGYVRRGLVMIEEFNCFCPLRGNLAVHVPLGIDEEKTG
jgi:hypothetical protein